MGRASFAPTAFLCSVWSWLQEFLVEQPHLSLPVPSQPTLSLAGPP